MEKWAKYYEDDSPRDISHLLALSKEELKRQTIELEKELGIYKKPEEQKEKIA